MAGTLPGGVATGTTAGGASSLSRGGVLLAQATGGGGGGGGGPGAGGRGDVGFGRGNGDPATVLCPFGESGQNGCATSSQLTGGKGGGIMGFNGGAAQVIATPGTADGNGGQNGCGGGGGVGNGLGGNGGGGLVVIEYGTPTS